MDDRATPGNLSGASWSQNPYIVSKTPSVRDHYQVSMIFRLLSGLAEEISRGLSFVVDTTFSRTNAQSTAPNFFYKAMLGAASDTIDDPGVKSSVNYYTDECLSKVLPQFNQNVDSGFLDRYFSREGGADQKLAQIPLGMEPFSNCLELKRGMNQSLSDYAHKHSSIYQRAVAEGTAIDKFWRGFGQNYDNWVTSNLLVNHFLDEQEGTMGLQKGTELPSTGGRVVQYIERFFSVDGKQLTREKVHEIGIQLVERFAPGHQYVLQTHTEEAHAHNHIVLNPVSIETGKRIQNKKHHLGTLRDLNDTIARENGLSVLPPQSTHDRRPGLSDKVKRIDNYRGRSRS